jgi:hypothetical protein
VSCDKRRKICTIKIKNMIKKIIINKTKTKEGKTSGKERDRV